jgi:hydrogenase expression/formation protein HypD
MKYMTEFRDRRLAEGMLRRLHELEGPPVKVMEVCGSHTVSIFRSGLRNLLPRWLTLISGPGCPVCVTSTGDIDLALSAAALPDVLLTTFGDMIRVPGSEGSLQEARAEGSSVKAVYSILEAMEIARQEPKTEVIFYSVGFETTAPTAAAAILQAEAEGLGNFYLLPVHKTVPPAMRALLQSGEVGVDGFLLPGHVSAVIGLAPYRFLAEEYGIPGVVAGFEPTDILQSLLALVAMIRQGSPSILNEYSRVVSPLGNPKAVATMERVFEASSVEWRGLGNIPGSGLSLRTEFRDFDALYAFGLTSVPKPEPKGCRCGDVVKGVIDPLHCPLFREVCSPQNPIGPCMVSTEGTCAAYYKYMEV